MVRFVCALTRNLIAGIFFLVISALALFVLVSFTLILFMPYLIEQERTAESEHQRKMMAAAWTGICSELDCTKLLHGEFLGFIDNKFYILPQRRMAARDGQCAVVGSDPKYRDYVDERRVRSANLHGYKIDFFLDCDNSTEGGTLWQSLILLDPWRSSFVRKMDVSNMPIRLGLNNPSALKPYAALSAGFLPASPSFGKQSVQQRKIEDRLVYLSNDPLFQGKHVLVSCSDLCWIQTVDLEGDASTSAPHLSLSFDFLDEDKVCQTDVMSESCSQSRAVHLEAIARLVAFLDKELSAARARYLTRFKM